jgi:hypothetical protein
MRRVVLQVGISGFGRRWYEWGMQQDEKVIEGLREAVRSALERAEEKMARVQKQLARGPAERRGPLPFEEDEAGWKALEESAEAVGREVDEELSQAQAAIEEFLRYGREVRERLREEVEGRK